MIPSDKDIAEMIEERAQAFMRHTHCSRDQAVESATAITSTLLLGDLLGHHIRDGFEAAAKSLTQKDTER